MSERDQILGRLSVLEQERQRLTMRMSGLCDAIRRAINPALIEVYDMDVAQAAQQMDDLVMAQAELMATNSKIGRLRKELGLG
ncbi:MAG: hypothetical protein ACYCYR_09540 [Desulfobulbaceae bacterium]|jgi:hypothetical protein